MPDFPAIEKSINEMLNRLIAQNKGERVNC